MANMMQKAQQWLAEKQKAHNSVSIVYSRGDDTVSLLATVGRTVFDVSDDYGAIIKRTSRDYLITAADLILAGAVAEPQRGDRIIETIGEAEHEFEVIGPGGDEPDWRYSDPFQILLRIHTKQVR